MAYRALYRQWRPKDFSHVVGQKPIMDTLRNQVIQDRIAHAYLFCGSRGTGKTSTAKILAKAINCEHPNNGDPCGECANCLRTEHDETLDVIEIDAASNNGVDEIRDLRDTVKYPPQFGKYKVYIIDEVHMLSSSAFNALLKTLEEPPAHIVFILATTEPQKLPETILSRCQRFDFGRIPAVEIQERLREAAEGSGAHVSNGALMTIARAAEGGMRDALSILDMCLGRGTEIDEEAVRDILGTCDQAFLFRFVDAFAQEDTESLFRMIDQVMRNGRDPAVFIRDISYHIRVLLLAKCCPGEIHHILELTEDDTAEFSRQSDLFSVTRLMQILDLFMKAENDMRYVSSPRLALESVCLRCCIRTDEADTRALLDRIESLEKKIEQLSAAKPVYAAPENRSESGTAVKKKEVKPQAAVEKRPLQTDGNSSVSSGLSALWKKLMDRLAKEQPTVWSMLTQGKISSASGDLIRWQPNKKEGSEFFIGSLNREDKKTVIQQGLKEIAGKELLFEAVSVTDVNEPASQTETAYINRLYETFGKEPVDIVDKI